MTDSAEGSTPGDDDKRRFPRIEGGLPLQYQVSSEGQFLQGQGHIEVLDVGMGGIRMRLDAAVEPQSQLYLHVTLPDGPVYTLARVAWCTEVEGRYLAGIEFLEASEADRERIMLAARG